MTAEAIRHPRRGKAHRPVDIGGADPAPRPLGFTATACDRWVNAERRGLTERVPVEQVAPEGLCRHCWPEVAR